MTSSTVYLTFQSWCSTLYFSTRGAILIHENHPVRLGVVGKTCKAAVTMSYPAVRRSAPKDEAPEEAHRCNENVLEQYCFFRPCIQPVALLRMMIHSLCQ